MESRNQRRRLEVHFRKQRGNAIAHFARGFIGERYRQHRGWRDVLLAYQMGDAVRDDARLSTAGASEDEHRSFGRRYCFTLLGIETREKIHYQPILLFD